MKNPKNNAIILTTIQGERGSAGFPGPAGQDCYTGVGDPRTLSLTLPDYSLDPISLSRGAEVLYYQDTSNGDIWTHNYFNGTPQPAGWVKTSSNVKGTKGDRGSTAIDKIDINLMEGTSPSAYTAADTPPVNGVYNTKVINYFYFPGTDYAPDFSEVKIVGNVTNNVANAIVIYSLSNVDPTIKTIVASGNIYNSNTGITALTVAAFPAINSILTLEITVIDPLSSGGILNLSYLSIR